MSPFIKIYCIGLYWLCVISTIVHMEHVTPINQPLALLVSLYSGYEGAGKAISVCEQVLAIQYRLSVTSETKNCINTTSRVLYKGVMAALI